MNARRIAATLAAVALTGTLLLTGTAAVAGDGKHHPTPSPTPTATVTPTPEPTVTPTPEPTVTASPTPTAPAPTPTIGTPQYPDTEPGPMTELPPTGLSDLIPVIALAALAFAVASVLFTIEAHRRGRTTRRTGKPANDQQPTP